MDYGPNIVAGDSAYLAGAFETVLEDGTVQKPPCTIHTDGSFLPLPGGEGGETVPDIPTEPTVDPDEPVIDPNDGYGGSGSGGNTGGTTVPETPPTPPEPETPSTGNSTDDWLNSVWDTGA